MGIHKTYATGPSNTFTSPVSGTSLWLRGDNVTESGGLVSDWHDNVHIGRDFTASGGDRPTLVSSDSNFNDKPSLSFDGTNNRLLAGSLNLSTLVSASAFTFYAVFRASAFGSDDSTSTANGKRFILHDSQSYWGIALGSSKFLAWTYDGNYDMTEAAISLSTTYAVEFYLDSGTNHLALTGGTTHSIAAGNISDLTNSMELGDQTTSANCEWNGHIAEVIVYNTTLSASLRTQNRSYLEARYGLTF